MPYLTRNDIEAIARRIITAYRKLPVLQGQTPNRVQPEILVKDLLGLTTGYHVLSRSGRILGLTSCGEVGVPIYDDLAQPEYYFLDGKTLLIEKSLLGEGANPGRYHFTLVHEACHQVYRMLFPKAYENCIAHRQIHYRTNTPAARTGDWEEWRTNALASAVLMPVEMLRQNMAAFGLGERVYMLNRVFAPAVYKQFSEMAGYMGVSRQALAIRLKQLNLLQHDCLRDPYALVNLYPEKEEWDV